MFLDLFDLKRVKRVALYIGIIVVVQIFQNLLFSRVELWGAKALLTPSLVVAVGMLEGGVTGGYLGLLAGFFLDMSFTENAILFTVLFTVIGFFSGYVSEYYVNKRLFAYLFIAAAALLITSLCQGVRTLVFYKAELAAIAAAALSQFIWSLPFSIPVYLLCSAVAEE